VNFAATIADLKEYIPGPDMGTNELALGWVEDETARAGGVPREAGAIPLDEIRLPGMASSLQSMWPMSKLGDH
jgi:hypothetical protein